MSKLPDEMGKAKKCLFLESLSQAAEMECPLSKGSGFNGEKSFLGEHSMNSSTGKYCLQWGESGWEQETSQSHLSLKDIYEARGPGRGDSKHINSK